MSEEEKKAIEIVEEILNCRGSIREDIDGHLEDISSLRTLLNLIKEQQKEIEELKNTETYKIAIIDKNKYVSKDKIKEKIKELEWAEDNYKCECDSCREIRDEGRYLAYKELLEEGE